MTAFILGLITAITYSGQSLLGKKLSSHLSAAALSFFTFVPAIPFLVAMLIVRSDFHIQWIPFLVSSTISFIINIMAWLLFYGSIKKAPVGLVVPITSLTPLFIIPVEFLLFGDLPDSLAFLGIILTIGGMFLLYHPHRTSGKNIQSGILMALGTAMLWSISATVDKIAIQSSSPFFYGFWIYLLLGIFFYIKSGEEISLRKIAPFKSWILLLGVVSAILIVAQFFAILMTNVSIVIMLKRSGAVLSVIGGKTFFKEKHFLWYLSGSLIIVSGVIIIGFSMI